MIIKFGSVVFLMPSTAVEKIKNISHIQITHAESGMGALREVVDALIK